MQQDKEVKKNMRVDKMRWVDEMANEAQISGNKGNIKGNITCNERPKRVDSVKIKD